ncbi:MAG TPA: GntR family transcriptional regulator [Anaerolineae bacterium]|nr:GntR family transcriptional regulator [Anaerolineae bacterium]
MDSDSAKPEPASLSSLLNRLQINHASPIPFYHQLKEQILSAIAEGILNEGDPLPSERELVEHLNISRMTIRRAFNELIVSGQLRSRQGKGTYIQAAKVEQRLARLAGFSADMTRAGHRITSRVLRSEVEAAAGSLVDHLQVKPGEPIVALERVRLVDGEPTSWERAYLPTRLCPELTRFDFERTSLYDILRREYHLNLCWARQRMEAALANWQEQQLLLIPEGAPILLSERTLYTDGDVVLEYGKSSYRGDRYRYEIDLIGDRLNECK